MTESEPNLSERLERISEGDQDALADIFSRYRARLRKMVRMRMDTRLQGRVDPSDVLQEAFIDISRRAPEQSKRADMPFFLWLRMITYQKLLEVHRRHLSTQRRDATRDVSIYHDRSGLNSRLLASQLLGQLTSASQMATRAEQQLMLEEVLNQMDPNDREILTLRHFEELTNGEVAQVLSLSKTAASNRYVRAVMRLKERLSEVPGFDLME